MSSSCIVSAHLELIRPARLACYDVHTNELETQTASEGFFIKEAKSLVVSIIGLIAVGFLTAWMILLLHHHLEVDRCLDAGGAFDYVNEVCLFSDVEAAIK